MANPNCPRCHGTGLITINYGGDGYGGRCAALADADDQPCPECEDWLSELEDDRPLMEIVESVRADRIAKGLNPDTGLPVQP